MVLTSSRASCCGVPLNVEQPVAATESGIELLPQLVLT